MSEKIKIGEKEYTLSPLRLKYLRRINDTLKEAPSTSIATIIDRYSPYIVASIQETEPDFKPEILQELTFEEFLVAWQGTLKSSGIVVQKKSASGELLPSQTSTGPESTDGSVSHLAGTIVQ